MNVVNTGGGSRDAWFFGVSGLLFAGSVTVTIVWCASMSSMGGMPMRGGWTMSMAWIPMCGQMWFGVAVSLLGMWVVMMMAMMLPSLVPMLWRYRRAVGGTHSGWITVGAGYFFVWTLFGGAVLPLGVALASLQMRQPALASAVPMAVGAVVLAAGAIQFTAWKARHLACCRASLAEAGSAWRVGMRLGLHCCCSCAGSAAILLGVGIMDLRVMVVVAAAITAERLAPLGLRVEHVTGAVAIGAGLFLIARAVWLG